MNDTLNGTNSQSGQAESAGNVFHTISNECEDAPMEFTDGKGEDWFRYSEKGGGVSATAHAKINLHLGVGDVRDDGYHELTTIFQSVSLADIVTLTPTRFLTEGPVVQSLTCDGELPLGDVPCDERNLAWKAVEAVATQFRTQLPQKMPLPQVTIHIDKRIPVAGGMAGGSADAAAALVAAESFFGEHYVKRAMGYGSTNAMGEISPDRLLSLGASLGSDIPFCLEGGTCLGTGRGEKLIPVLTRGNYWWAIAISREGLSTPEVFKHLDHQREEMAAGTREERRIGPPDDLQRALMHADPERVGELLANDLQPAAISLQPTLRRTVETGKKAGALGAIVSGSGPSVAFLCADADQAYTVLTELSAAGVCASATVACSPAEGAHVVNTDPQDESS